MPLYRIGIVALSLGLLPPHAAALDDAVSGKSTSSPPHRSAPTQWARTSQSNATAGVKRAAAGRIGGASRDVRHLADWVVDSGDNAGLPFVIVDKTNARVFVFDASGRIQGTAPALLGVTRGDHTVPGIGDRELSDMPPETRTTPAGRFVAARGMSTRGEDVLWVDYEAGVSLHRVITTLPEERRLQRLASPTPLDNRISYGCINVPARFYEKVVVPAFERGNGIVYVLPETRPTREVFGSYDVDKRARHQDPVQAQVAPIAGASTDQAPPRQEK